MYNFSVFLRAGAMPCRNISNIEINDGYFGALLCELTPPHIVDIREALIERMQRIVIYTVRLPLNEHRNYVETIRNAAAIGVKNLKICLCTLECGHKTRIEQLREVVSIAEAFNIRVLFEGGGKYAFFDDEFYDSVKTDGTGLIFSPLRYVKEGKNPFLQVMYKSKCRDDIRVLRVNDGLYTGGVPTMIEEGNGEIKECASALLARGFDGYFSFKPYLPGVSVDAIVERFLTTLKEM